MKPLFTDKEYNSAKSMDKLSCECYYCEEAFYEIKKRITEFKKGNSTRTLKSCSKKECKAKQQSKTHNKQKLVTCENCDKEFSKTRSQIKKSNNNFCSRSCSATHNNKNKTHGTRRSKLEVWLEEQLAYLYPELKIHYNQKDAINSELDIYIPSFNLAIEINGIFHYKPIFGEDKFNNIIKNDQNKLQACIDEGIEIISIDVSQMNYFKPKKAQKYLDIICQLISNKSKNMLKS